MKWWRVVRRVGGERRTWVEEKREERGEMKNKIKINKKIKKYKNII